MKRSWGEFSGEKVGFAESFGVRAGKWENRIPSHLLLSSSVC